MKYLLPMIVAAMLIAAPSADARRGTLICAPGWDNVAIVNSADRSMVSCELLKVGKVRVRKARRLS